MSGRLPTVVAVALSLTTIALPARADSVADFYKGKQISLIIGTSTGNDYDEHEATYEWFDTWMVIGKGSFTAAVD